MHEALNEVYYWLALINFKGKNFDKSIAYARKVITGYSQSQFYWWAYYLIANNNFELGKKQEYEKILKKIIKESPEEEIVDNSYSQLLSFYLREKQYSVVISRGQDYIRNHPKGKLRAKVYFYSGESYYAQGEWTKAANSYKRALDESHDKNISDLSTQGLGFAYLARGDKGDARRCIDKIKDKQLRLFSQGVFYFKVEDYLQALDTFKIFIRDYPGSSFLSEAYLNKADILYELGRLKDSVSVYKYILQNFSSVAHRDILNKAHYGLAWCYLKDGKFKQAVSEFESTLEYTDNPVVKISSQIQIADAYQETDKYDEALKLYNNILEDYPHTVYADYIQFQIGMTFLKKKELEKAFFALKNLTNNFPASKLIPEAQYYLAVGYFSRQDYVQTRNLLEDFLNKFPRHDLAPRVHYLYAKCFFNEKNYREALKVFKKIIGRFNDRDTEELAYIDMGNAYLNLSMFEQAKKVWKDFLKKYPHSQYAGSVGLYLGGVSEKEKKYSEAQKYYRQVINDHKDSSWGQEALFSLGHLYWNRGDIDKAEEYFRQLAQDETPLGLKAKLYLAKVTAYKGELSQALKLYNLLSDSPGNIAGIALTEKAFLLKEMKNYQQAIKAFRAVIKKGVDTPDVRFSLGICLEKASQNDEAIEEYFKVIYIFSGEDEEKVNDPKGYRVKAYFRIARIHEKYNKLKEAKKVYQKIVALDVEESKIAQMRLEELESW